MKTHTTKVIVVANQKGGVGKTKTADIVARDLAAQNYKVLVIDWDPQATLTKHFCKGIDVEFSTIDNTPVDSSVIFTSSAFPEPKRIPINQEQTIFLDMLFASSSLNKNAESAGTARELKLKNYLKKIKEQSIYDYIVLDTPGALGVLFTNAILSTDFILLPIQTNSDTTDSTEPFFKELILLEELFENEIEKIIFFGNMFNKVAAHDKEQLEIIQNDIPFYIEEYKKAGHFKNLQYSIVKEVPMRTVIKDAAGSGMYLRDYVKTYANTKSNKEMLETYNEIFKQITNQDFEEK